MVRILPAIARFQVRIIAMCGDPKSTLAQNAHLFLDVNIEQEACPLNLAPTSSTTVMLALGDALGDGVAGSARLSTKKILRKIPSRSE
jgi:arabinose-5-phosphate isomerase